MSRAKPFLKWAGGKTQLLPQIDIKLPHTLYDNEFTYIEPFVGGGAALFWMLAKFPNIKKAIINDINIDLINTYRTIANEPSDLITVLSRLQLEYHSFLDNEDEKKKYYYEKRELYNSKNSSIILQSALFIFLNRTCFNGLYRVNRKNGFNVPMGRYKKPTICDTDNILLVSKLLSKVEILCEDFEKTYDFLDDKSFVYLDPPYRPLNSTSNFNSYSNEVFDDFNQERLFHYCNKLNNDNHKWMLSNSDPKNVDSDDDFFDKLYSDFFIERVKAKRNINSNSNKRGEIHELLITNYKNEQTLQIA